MKPAAAGAARRLAVLLWTTTDVCWRGRLVVFRATLALSIVPRMSELQPVYLVRRADRSFRATVKAGSQENFAAAVHHRPRSGAGIPWSKWPPRNYCAPPPVGPTQQARDRFVPGQSRVLHYRLATQPLAPRDD